MCIRDSANGVHLAPSQYEAMFVGLTHTDEAIGQTITAAERAFAAVAAVADATGIA